MLVFWENVTRCGSMTKLEIQRFLTSCSSGHALISGYRCGSQYLYVCGKHAQSLPPTDPRSLSAMNSIIGGYNPVTKATAEAQEICDKIRPSVQAQVNTVFSEFTAVEHRSQVVAGTNWQIKVHVGGQNYVHITVFEALGCNGGELTLSGVESDMKKDSPL
uniref:Cystatin-B n=2 Tax=Neogobius melanostomus TaxID=47308 RepID=A0A8C6UGK6_9GOBI